MVVVVFVKVLSGSSSISSISSIVVVVVIRREVPQESKQHERVG